MSYLSNIYDNFHSLVHIICMIYIIGFPIFFVYTMKKLGYSSVNDHYPEGYRSLQFLNLVWYIAFLIYLLLPYPEIIGTWLSA